mmetsp:Transcript_9335/g.15165  ORF Transcript_9335/g.15165 Transcript_9335/m.15165 type:complete len:885 (-) Transcript_9335:156-2810(-)
MAEEPTKQNRLPHNPLSPVKVDQFKKHAEKKFIRNIRNDGDFGKRPSEEDWEARIEAYQENKRSNRAQPRVIHRVNASDLEDLMDSGALSLDQLSDIAGSGRSGDSSPSSRRTKRAPAEEHGKRIELLKRQFRQIAKQLKQAHSFGTRNEHANFLDYQLRDIRDQLIKAQDQEEVMKKRRSKLKLDIDPDPIVPPRGGEQPANRMTGEEKKAKNGKIFGSRSRSHSPSSESRKAAVATDDKAAETTTFDEGGALMSSSTRAERVNSDDLQYLPMLLRQGGYGASSLGRMGEMIAYLSNLHTLFSDELQWLMETPDQDTISSSDCMPTIRIFWQEIQRLLKSMRNAHAEAAERLEKMVPKLQEQREEFVAHLGAVVNEYQRSDRKISRMHRDARACAQHATSEGGPTARKRYMEARLQYNEFARGYDKKVREWIRSVEDQELQRMKLLTSNMKDCAKVEMHVAESTQAIAVRIPMQKLLNSQFNALLEKDLVSFSELLGERGSGRKSIPEEPEELLRRLTPSPENSKMLAGEGEGGGGEGILAAAPTQNDDDNDASAHTSLNLLVRNVGTDGGSNSDISSSEIVMTTTSTEKTSTNSVQAYTSRRLSAPFRQSQILSRPGTLKTVKSSTEKRGDEVKNSVSNPEIIQIQKNSMKRGSLSLRNIAIKPFNDFEEAYEEEEETQIMSPTNILKSLKLMDVITDPVGIKYFSSHLRQECSHENIVFWRQVENFRTKWKDKDYTKEQLISTARILYSQFFTGSCLMELNIDARTRSKIRKKFEKKEVTENVFDVAQKEIYDLMKNDSFKRFKKSRLCLRFVRAITKRQQEQLAAKDKEEIKNLHQGRKANTVESSVGDDSKDGSHTKKASYGGVSGLWSWKAEKQNRDR